MVFAEDVIGGLSGLVLMLEWEMGISFVGLVEDVVG